MLKKYFTGFFCAGFRKFKKSLLQCVKMVKQLPTICINCWCLRGLFVYLKVEMCWMMNVGRKRVIRKRNENRDWQQGRMQFFKYLVYSHKKMNLYQENMLNIVFIRQPIIFLIHFPLSSVYRKVCLHPIKTL